MKVARLVLVVVLLAVLGCAGGAPPPPEPNPYLGPPPPPNAEENIAFLGGNGSSCEEAIVIMGAANTLLGLRAENQWLAEHYPGSERLSTHQGDCVDTITDVVQIRTVDGVSKFVYFDITEFYGKW